MISLNCSFFFFLEWTDCTGYILDDFKKQELRPKRLNGVFL